MLLASLQSCRVALLLFSIISAPATCSRKLYQVH
jgi:hypothetical protein